MSPPETVAMKDRAAWRSWLSKNHAKKKEVWLVYAKKHSDAESVSYEEAVEEAICFGWIDGQVRTIDDNRFMQRFSPRTNKSGWSETNIARARRMIDAGLMTGAGREVFEKAMQENRTIAPLSHRAVPAELDAALANNPAAAENFRNMTPSQQGMYAAWVSSAKRPETRQARAERSAGFLEEGKRLIDVFGFGKKRS